MGISGLLPLLKSIQKSTHIKSFAGQTVAIDAYGWLHRGTIACAVDLALEKPTRRYIDFTLDRVRMLKHYGVVPYMVFDGDYLPGKAGTEVEREKRRALAKENGLQLLKAGRTSQAQLELQKAIDVTPRMACLLIEELKLMGVKFVVAPYEADAQMAYLERKGLVSAIISEDSDLLVFGAKCLITKLDQYGECIEINRSDFSAVEEISLAGWSDEEFCRMAILSGCDYLTNIPKMGLKTAYRIVRRYKTIDRILKAIQVDGSFIIPAGYNKDFRKAELTFQYQRVFCSTTKTLVFCQESEKMPDPESDEMSMIGKPLTNEVALGVAEGLLDPMTKMPIGLKAAKPVSYQNYDKTQSFTNFFKLKSGPFLTSTTSSTSVTIKKPLRERSTNIQSSARVVEGTPILNSLKKTTSLAKSLMMASETVQGFETTTIEATIPPKRQRLCEQEQEDSDEFEESPFFRSSKKSRSSQSSFNTQTLPELTPSQNTLSAFFEEAGLSLEEGQRLTMGSPLPTPQEDEPQPSKTNALEYFLCKTQPDQKSQKHNTILSQTSSTRPSTLGKSAKSVERAAVRRTTSAVFPEMQSGKLLKSKSISKQTSLDFSTFKMVPKSSN